MTEVHPLDQVAQVPIQPDDHLPHLNHHPFFWWNSRYSCSSGLQAHILYSSNLCNLPNKFMCVCNFSISIKMLGMNVILRLIHMSMSHLFRLDIPFLLQLQPFRYSVLKSLHHFMNHPLPCYLGTKKGSNGTHTGGKRQGSRHEGVANITQSSKLISTWAAKEGSNMHLSSPQASKSPSCFTYFNFLHTTSQQNTKREQIWKLRVSVLKTD